MTDTKKRIQFEDPKHDAKSLEQLEQFGRTDVARENALLRFMFHVSPTLHFDDKERNFRLAQQLHRKCDLKLYRAPDTTCDTGYSTSTEFHDMFHQVLSPLDALVDRGLVYFEYYILFDNEVLVPDREVRVLTPDTKDWKIDYQQRLDGVTQAAANSEIANIGENELYTLWFVGAKYSLTTKGYDVALKFQEHEDEAKRFNQQTEIVVRSAKSAASSAKTARIALWAAGAIAAGSLGNLIFNLITHWR